MLAVKKTIPKLVAGMLALTGCADVSKPDPGAAGSGGSGGTGGTGATGGGGMAGAGGTAGMGGVGGSSGNTLDDAIASFCMKAIDCGYIIYTVPDCTDYYSDLILPGDATCYAAALSYFDCLVGVAGCEDFSDCFVAGDAFEVACS